MNASKCEREKECVTEKELVLHNLMLLYQSSLACLWRVITILWPLNADTAILQQMVKPPRIEQPESRHGQVIPGHKYKSKEGTLCICSQQTLD